MGDAIMATANKSGRPYTERGGLAIAPYSISRLESLMKHHLTQAASNISGMMFMEPNSISLEHWAHDPSRLPNVDNEGITRHLRCNGIHESPAGE